MKTENQKKPTEVVITIDTEFSVGGAFDDPSGQTRPVGEPNVTGPVNGEEQGLGFMLDIFAHHDVPATFFVETLQTRHFGPEPMGKLVSRIADAGHDLQMHLHPLWLAFDGERMVQDTPWPPDDDCASRSVEELAAMMRRGIRTFAAWGLPRPVALRTGNLAVDRNVYQAQAKVGLPLASNIGLTVSQPDDPALQLKAGRHRIEGVLELPVLCFKEFEIGQYCRRRILQIRSTGWREQKSALKRARAAGAETVVVLTHPFEFFKRGDQQCRQIRPNRLSQRRLEKLCSFVQANPSSFRFTTFGSSKEKWLAAADRPECDIAIPPAPMVARLLHNKLNELVWWY